MISNIESFFHGSTMHLLEKWGMPVGIIIESPYELSWASGSEVVFNAEDHLFKIPDKYHSVKVGWFGNDHAYFGIWEKSTTEHGAALEGFAAIVMLILIVGVFLYWYGTSLFSVAVNFSDIISGIF